MLIKTIARILRNTQDYVSYGAALHFLGIEATPPAAITIVSSGRRRSRCIGTTELRFAFHPPERPRSVQKLGGTRVGFLVATVEQILVDMVADPQHAYPFQELGDLFARLSYGPDHLIDLAEAYGDTVTKRVMFWLIWSGRIGFDETVKFKAHTVVKLIPDGAMRESGDPNPIVEPCSRVEFPAMLLQRPVPQGPSGLPEATKAWMELRRYAPFRVWISALRWLPIRGEPERDREHALASFFHRDLERVMGADLSGLLVELAPAGRRENTYPELLRQWVLAGADLPPQWIPLLVAWVRDALGGTDPDRLGAALFFAMQTGQEDCALAMMPQVAPRLLARNRLSALVQFVEWAAGHGRLSTIEMKILFVRVLYYSSRLREARDSVETIRSECDRQLTDEHRAQLAFLSGNILRQMQQIGPAIKELIAARRIYMQLGDTQRQISFAMAIGALELFRFRFASARKYYGQAYELAGQGAPSVMTARVLEGMAMVEIKTCCHERAQRYLREAVEIYRRLGDAVGEVGALLSQASDIGCRGEIGRELCLLFGAHRLADQVPPSIQVSMWLRTYWVYELLGKSAVGHLYRQRSLTLAASDRSTFSETLPLWADGLAGILHGEFASAVASFTKLLNDETNRPAPADDMGVAKFLLGFAQFLSGSVDFVGTWRQSRCLLKRLPITRRTDHIWVVTAILCPEKFSDENLEQRLERLVADRFFDVFWVYYAGALHQRGSRVGQKYLELQSELTSTDLKTFLRGRIPGLTAALRRLTRQTRSFTPIAHFSGGRTEVWTVDRYSAWRNEVHPGVFVVDSIAGHVGYLPQSQYLRPGSATIRFLVQLLLASPTPVAVSAMFRGVWGGTYDPATGEQAVRACVTRIRRLLQVLTPSIRLITNFGANALPQVALELDCQWEAVFA